MKGYASPNHEYTTVVTLSFAMVFFVRKLPASYSRKRWFPGVGDGVSHTDGGLVGPLVKMNLWKTIGPDIPSHKNILSSLPALKYLGFFLFR